MKFPDAVILLFAREPVPGAVKTRLIPMLGEAGTMDLYCQLLARQMTLLSGNDLCPAELWTDGDPEHSAFAEFKGDRRRQQGMDLGERMLNAAGDALWRYRRVILIGVDCPAMDESYLGAALEALDAGNNAVVGPAWDGGYVLLGMRESKPPVFSGIDWGSDQVMRQTEARLEEQGYRYSVLPALQDVDRPEDLEQLAEYGIYPKITRHLISL